MRRSTKGTRLVLFLAVVNVMIGCAKDREKDYPVRPVPFTHVRIEDEFWLPRMETNRAVTIPFDFRKCEETGRIDNFAKAGGLMEGEFEGYRYNDSDVFKVMEGAAYSLALHPDPDLEDYLDELIAKIEASQEEDGYLYTTRTIDPEHPAPGAGNTRWSNLKDSHELYNVGHMYEAAVAYYQATGKRHFLEVAIKNANLVDEVFGPGKRRDVPGHQEIEIGLSKLYRTTGDERYLRLAKFFLVERGHTHDRDLYTFQFNEGYIQDHKPVLEQDEAVGHAVRAGYMYSGMADAAALTGDRDYAKATTRIWENVVSKKLYLTGGIGARREGEAFGDNYELPNAEAYNETCAAVANMLWNHRLFLLHGDAKYIDVFERTLYNGFLSGVSLEGDRFFYPNPLESDGNFKFNGSSATRRSWFTTSCCPTNVVRFMPSISEYVYATSEDRLYVNLFMQGSAEIVVNGSMVRVTQQTRYPWDGIVKLTVDPEQPSRFSVCVRIPGWARNSPVPSDLYRYAGESDDKPHIEVNGKPAKISLRDGYAHIRRVWHEGDVLRLKLSMKVRRVLSHEKVRGNIGKVALERGPVVYCAEGVDNGGDVGNLSIPDDASLTTEYREDLLNGVVVIKGRPRQVSRASGKIFESKLSSEFMLVPYYSWSHRGTGDMAVWFRRGP
ncbi:MAG: glycoside hydrolase family 127 protein [Candidatus Neomarinimicrobiota bacterium]